MINAQILRWIWIKVIFKVLLRLGGRVSQKGIFQGKGKVREFSQKDSKNID